MGCFRHFHTSDHKKNPEPGVSRLRISAFIRVSALPALRNLTITKTSVGSLLIYSLPIISKTNDVTDDQMMRYGLLMQTLGNKPEIFGDNPYAIAVQDVLHYDIPGEALTDERFRRMITEAEKYLGYSVS